MTAFEFQTQLVSLTGFVNHFAKKYARDDDAAKDLAQETLLRAFMNYDKFKTNNNLKGWLHVIMRNIFINSYRRQSVRVVKYDSALFAVMQGETDHYSPDDIFHKQQIEKAIHELPDEVKIPFQRHCSGFKYQEIADEMNLPIGTVKSRIFQARKILTQQILYA